MASWQPQIAAKKQIKTFHKNLILKIGIELNLEFDECKLNKITTSLHHKIYFAHIFVLIAKRKVHRYENDYTMKIIRLLIYTYKIFLEVLLYSVK